MADYLDVNLAVKRADCWAVKKDFQKVQNSVVVKAGC
jgi:hypothetical protein